MFTELISFGTGHYHTGLVFTGFLLNNTLISRNVVRTLLQNSSPALNVVVIGLVKLGYTNGQGKKKTQIVLSNILNSSHIL